MPSTCENCEHWTEHGEINQHEIDLYTDGESPTNWGTCDQAQTSRRFYTRDASDYASWLRTRSDFGCIEHSIRLVDS